MLYVIVIIHFVHLVVFHLIPYYIFYNWKNTLSTHSEVEIN